MYDKIGATDACITPRLAQFYARFVYDADSGRAPSPSQAVNNPALAGPTAASSLKASYLFR